MSTLRTAGIWLVSYGGAVVAGYLVLVYVALWYVNGELPWWFFLPALVPPVLGWVLASSATRGRYEAAALGSAVVAVLLLMAWSLLLRLQVDRPANLLDYAVAFVGGTGLAVPAVVLVSPLLAALRAMLTSVRARREVAVS